METNPETQEAASQIERFARQYLQLESSGGGLDYPDATLLREPRVQERLYDALFRRGDDEGSLTHRPPPRYELRVLKELVRRVEEGIEDWDEYGVSDGLMDALSSLLSRPLPPEIEAAQQKCYVTYTLSLLHRSLPNPAAGTSPFPSSSAQQAGGGDMPEDPAPQITLLEARSLISAGGTTGLRTWEAALHLGQYLCGHPELVRGREVLELGAGTGYLSVLCARHLGAARVVASDGSDEVVSNLGDNFYLNGLEGDSRENHHQGTAVVPMDLKWGHALLGTEEAEWNGGRQVDLVIGADITYDRSVIPALVSTLFELVGLFPSVEMLVAATERNRETYEAFLGACDKKGLQVQHVDFPVPRRREQTGPFYGDGTPIRTCRIRRAG